MSYIEIRDLSFSYADDKRLILKDISLEVKKGEFVCLRAVGVREKYIFTSPGGTGAVDKRRTSSRWRNGYKSKLKQRGGFSGLRTVSVDDCRGKYSAGPDTEISQEG